jgi:hypothetical protein
VGKAKRAQTGDDAKYDWLQSSIFASHFNLIWPVRILSQEYSASLPAKTSGLSLPSRARATEAYASARHKNFFGSIDLNQRELAVRDDFLRAALGGQLT